MNKMLIDLDQKDSHLIIRIDGELDANTCLLADKEFEKALAVNPDVMFVDCSELSYISSAGIGVLISLHHSCTQQNTPIYFCNIQSKVKNVLEILGLDRVFTFHETLEQAIETAPASKK